MIEAFFVAPLFLHICIAVFGAWVKHKNIFNWVIFKENIAIFAENVFLTQTTLSWTKLSPSTFFHTLKYWYQYTDLGL